MENTIGFIGGGRVVKILLQGFKNKHVRFGKIFVSDINPEVLNILRREFPEVEISGSEVSAAQDIVFIALHPPVIMDMLESLKGNFKEGSTVISLAPKISFQKLESKLTGITNIARMIPNATSYINKGYNPVSFSTRFDASVKKIIMELLGNLGYTFEVSEEKLESYAIMSAMLPTYFWFQWRELEEIGQKTGLTADESKQSIYQTLVAALDLFYKSGLTPAEVIDLIPVKPIGEHEAQIAEIYKTKLIGLFDKIKP